MLQCHSSADMTLSEEGARNRHSGRYGVTSLLELSKNKLAELLDKILGCNAS